MRKFIVLALLLPLLVSCYAFLRADKLEYHGSMNRTPFYHVPDTLPSKNQ